MTETERNLLYGVVSLILPENILDQFDIVKFEEEDIARNDGSYQPFKRNVHIYLDEQDNRTAEQYATLKPNGFTEYTSVKDYPVRNRLLTLHIRRRRYLDADDKSVILSEFPIKVGENMRPIQRLMFIQTPKAVNGEGQYKGQVKQNGLNALYEIWTKRIN